MSCEQRIAPPLPPARPPPPPPEDSDSDYSDYEENEEEICSETIQNEEEQDTPEDNSSKDSHENCECPERANQPMSEDENSGKDKTDTQDDHIDSRGDDKKVENHEPIKKNDEPKKSHYVLVTIEKDDTTIEDIMDVGQTSDLYQKTNESFFIEEDNQDLSSSAMRKSSNSKPRIRYGISESQFKKIREQAQKSSQKRYDSLLQSHSSPLLQNQKALKKLNPTRGDEDGKWRVIPETLTQKELKQKIEELEMKLKLIYHENEKLQTKQSELKDQSSRLMSEINELSFQVDDIQDQMETTDN